MQLLFICSDAECTRFPSIYLTLQIQIKPREIVKWEIVKTMFIVTVASGYAVDIMICRRVWIHEHRLCDRWIECCWNLPIHSSFSCSTWPMAVDFLNGCTVETMKIFERISWRDILQKKKARNCFFFSKLQSDTSKISSKSSLFTQSVHSKSPSWSAYIYLGYGELFGPIQLTSSVSAFPDRYLSFVSVVHRSVGYDDHIDFDLTRSECTNEDTHIVKIVYTVKTYEWIQLN